MRTLLFLTILAHALPAQDARQSNVLAGKVVDEKHRPLEGVRVVHALPSGTVAEVRTEVGRTDANGAFRVRVPIRLAARARIQPLEYLRFETEGRLVAQVYVSSWYWMMTGKNRGGVHDLGTVRLPGGKPIPCRIRRPGGRPLEGAKIVARSPLSTATVYSSTAVQYFCEARTDKKGAATILGLGDDALEILVSAEGFYQHAAPAHPPGMPFVVAMKASGVVTGTVVTHDGDPVSCLIGLRSEVNTSRQNMLAVGQGYGTRSAPDGTFRINVDNPGRFRLTATPADRPSYSFGINGATSELLDGPKQGIEIRLPKPRGVEGGVALKVVDRKTGRKVPAFRAAVVWQDPTHLQDSMLDYQFRMMAQESTKAGEMLLEPPPQRSQLKGVVIVKAEGYATEVYKLLKWKDDKPVRVKMELEPEIPVEGLVVDSAGKPIADAAVWTQRPAKKKKGAVVHFGPSRTPGAVRTDAKGRFRIPHLRPGHYDVCVAHHAHADMPPKEVHVKEATSLKLELASGCAVAGKLTAKPIRPGWRLVLSKSTGVQNPFAAIQQNSDERVVEVKEDGSFAFRGVTKGRYALTLAVPQVRGEDLRIQIPGKIKVDGDKADLKIDASEAIPGRIRGKLSIEGIAPPPGRIVISAESAKSDASLAFLTQLSGMRGTACTVAKDKSFDLELAPGKYHLTVLDIATRTILLRTEDAIEVDAGATTTAPLALELAMVRVRLRPEKEGGGIASGKLSVKIEWGTKPQNTGFLSMMGAVHGLPMHEGEHDTVLYLPNREVQLTITSTARMLAKNLDPTQIFVMKNNEPLAQKAFIPKMGEINRVDLKVKPPPEIDK